MSTLTLEIPGETLMAMRGDADSVGARLLLAAAAKLFEMGELSSGAAARLAGILRTTFLTKIADFGVDTFSLTEEDLHKETRLA